MQDKRTQTVAFAMLGLVMLFWAGNAIVGRAMRDDIPPFTLALVRWCGAFLVISPFALASVWRDRATILNGWKIIVVLGVLGVGAFNGLLYLGLHYTTATNALLLQASIPAFVVLFDLLLFGTRADPVQAGGVVLSTLGVIAIVFEGDPSAALRLHFGLGDLYVLAAVIVWAFYTVLLRLRPAISQVSFIWVTFAIGVMCMAPLAIGEWAAGQRVAWSMPVLGAFAYVALLPSLAAYYIYNWATGQVGPARAGQAIAMMPLFGALLSVLLLGETLHSYHLVGMAMILTGIVIGALALRLKDSAGVSQAPPLEGKG